MKKRKLSPFLAVFHLIPLIFKHSPLLIFFYAMLTLLVSVLSGLTVYTNQYFYDSLIGVISENGAITEAVIGAAVMLLIMIVVQIFGKTNGFIWVHLGDKIEFSLMYEYNKKIAEVSAVSFEDTEFLESIEKAHDGIYGAIGMFATICEIILYFGGYFAITGVYLWHVQPVLLFALVIVFIPTAITTMLQSKMYAEEADEVITLRRKVNSDMGAALNPRETRLFGVFDFFYGRIFTTQKAIFCRKWETEKKNCNIQLALNLCKMIGWCGIVLLMISELIKGRITVGVFAAVYTSMGTMFANCESLLSRIKVDISENLGMMEDFINFLYTPLGSSKEAEVDMKKGIQVKNISFAYPGVEKNAVDNVSLTLSFGETVAIVGENGSGKTTLAKLLCGLYPPDKGEVLIGGIDSSTVRAEELFSNTSAVFQDYVRYSSLSLSENVRIGDYKKEDDINFALQLTGAVASCTLENGYDTIMSREFDGMELSGGQWQRIAMTRGLYRSHDLIFLDEPTAAIDPLEESNIYKMFASIAKDKACVLITHRLGSARIADRIFVMDGGHIVESGTHEELIYQGGRYEKMWKATADWYQ